LKASAFEVFVVLTTLLSPQTLTPLIAYLVSAQ
jgi:hypothetical protein